MKKKYEATIGKYTFMMTDDNVIEIWLNTDDDYPMSFIVADPVNIKTEKDFQKEISWWFMDNC